jgi:glycosyltransferase involved in cell wall biosynthesis
MKKRVEDYKKMELSNFQVADQIIAITKKELDDIKKLAGTKSILIIPNIHEIHLERNIPVFSKRKNLLFIGHYLHNPNSDAMLYFVKEIFPLIKKSIPTIKLVMIGSSITNEIKKLASDDIDAVGFVENLDPYLNNARVFVAPLRFGAGMKGKIGQALAYGLPVVTTSIGAEGMGLQDGKTILEANTAKAFAKQVVKLYNSPTLWKKLSLNGSRHIDKFYSKKTCKKFIQKMLEN